MATSFAFALYGRAIGLGSGDGGVMRDPMVSGVAFEAGAPGVGSATSEIVPVGSSTKIKFAAAVGTPEVYGIG